MSDMKKIVAERVFDQLFEMEELDLTTAEVATHTAKFLSDAYDQTKLSSKYGYTPEEALRFQVEEYCRDTFGWADAREGNE